MKTWNALLSALIAPSMAGCCGGEGSRSMLAPWVKPDAFELPLALASTSVSTNEFTFRAARYGIYVFHHAPCPTSQTLHATNEYDRLQLYKRQLPCDITITIHKAWLEGPVLFRQTITNAELGGGSNDEAFYDLGHFETSEKGKLVMVLSNNPSAHNDSICHARVIVAEILHM